MLLISVPFLPHDNKFSAYWMRFDGELTLMSTSACFFVELVTVFFGSTKKNETFAHQFQILNIMASNLNRLFVMICHII